MMKPNLLDFLSWVTLLVLDIRNLCLIQDDKDLKKLSSRSFQGLKFCICSRIWWVSSVRSRKCGLASALWLTLSQSTKAGLHRFICTWLSSCPSASWPGHPSLRTWTLYCCWSLGHMYGSLLHLCCHTHLCLHTTASVCPNHCNFMALPETRTCVLRSCFASNYLALLASFLVHIFLESYFILAAKTSAEKFLGRVSLCSPGCSQIHDPPDSAAQVLGLQACTTYLTLRLLSQIQ